MAGDPSARGSNGLAAATYNARRPDGGVSNENAIRVIDGDS
jgi:hypothetical protein